MFFGSRSDLTTRKLQFAGKNLYAVGKSGDPYFDHLSIDDLDFFIKSYKATLKPDDVVFDVGANLGLTSVVFSKLNNSAKIYSFEPSKNIYRCLEETIKENKADNCFPLQMALSARPGSSSFSDNPTSASASHLSTAGDSLGHASYSVDVSTIDIICLEKKHERLDFIKIDVEGFEIDVLQGGIDSLHRLKPTVFLEFNSFTMIAYRNINPRSLLDKLTWIFPYVYFYSDSNLVALDSDGRMLDFIHRNLVSHGCVDDLLCSFAPISF
jgi:FkbM family methyltransferase